ncbi:hypothetical protein EG68_01341 [Paragonimus skrjabini miyazakii]|uniref:Uncharacterized protein n=1 Tax=Paragonimus skrjabini miyazakii TaxID=59628 RepID=A0A8S9Z728_9TREM|nr:hypothetical protein EG68_01341 [Paragonimus skrjabini miyazakii]
MNLSSHGTHKICRSHPPFDHCNNCSERELVVVHVPSTPALHNHYLMGKYCQVNVNHSFIEPNCESKHGFCPNFQKTQRCHGRQSHKLFFTTGDHPSTGNIQSLKIFYTITKCVQPLFSKFSQIFVSLLMLFANCIVCVHSLPTSSPTRQLAQNSSTEPRTNSPTHQLVVWNDTLLDRSATTPSPSTTANRRSTSNHLLDQPLVKVYMRSERTRRSLEYFMSSRHTDPFFLTSTDSGSHMNKYLSVTDDGRVLLKTTASEAGQMTISVIVQAQKLKRHKKPWELLQPRDNVAVILRRFETNICVCMSSSGIVTTERLVNQTVSDNCEWRLRISRHGVGFERLIYNEELYPLSYSPREFQSAVQLMTTSQPKQPQYRVATLSTLGKWSDLASGWLHKLWQPEATWTVYHTNLSFVKNGNLTEGTIKGSIVKSIRKNDIDTTTLRENETETGTRMRIGDREVYTKEAAAKEIHRIYETERTKHCNKLYSNLTYTVQREILASVDVLEKLQHVFRQLDKQLLVNPPIFKGTSMTRLIDEWMFLSDLRWQQKIRAVMKRDRRIPALGCSLSFKNSYLKSFDRSTAILLENNHFTKLHHDIFLKVQHLASWTPLERIKWLKHPRLSILFKFLGLRLPSSSQLRKAAFVLHRYLAHPIIFNSEPFHFLTNRFTRDNLTKIFTNRTVTRFLLNRAALLKFEELLFWLRPVRRSNGYTLDTSIISSDSLRSELQEMRVDSLCYTTFLSKWRAQRVLDSPEECTFPRKSSVSKPPSLFATATNLS